MADDVISSGKDMVVDSNSAYSADGLPNERSEAVERFSLPADDQCDDIPSVDALSISESHESSMPDSPSETGEPADLPPFDDSILSDGRFRRFGSSHKTGEPDLESLLLKSCEPELIAGYQCAKCKTV